MNQQPAANSSRSSEIQLLNNLVILYPAFEKAVKRLQECFDYAVAGRGRCAACFDPSGTGRSHLAQYFAKKHPHFDCPSGRIMPVVYVRLLPGLSVKQAAAQILKTIGDPLFSRGNAFEKTERIYYFFEKCQVRMLILDEANHFVDNRMGIVHEAADWLKNLIEASKISVILLGIEKSIQVLLQDVQLRRRFSAPFTIDRFVWTTESGGNEYRSILEKFSEEEISVSMGMRILRGPDVAYRLFCASSGMIGYTAKFIEEAIIIARREGCIDLTQAHFRAGFTESFIQEGARLANPFDPDIEPEPINLLKSSHLRDDRAARRVQMAKALNKTLEQEIWGHDEQWRPNIKVTPDPREGYLSVVLRVGEENFIFDGDSLMFLLRIGKGFDRDSRLKWRLRMSNEEFDSFTLNGSAYPPRIHYKGRSFSADPFCVSSPRYCPLCVACAGILLAHWDIYLTTACDIHHCFLLDRCQECGRLGTINNRMSLTHCRCGFDLRTAAVEPADQANIKISTLVAISFGTSLNAPRNLAYPHFPPINKTIRFDDLLTSMNGLLGRRCDFEQTVDGWANRITEALRVFEPMICLPTPEELVWVGTSA
jgi:hypothetical protein